MSIKSPLSIRWSRLVVAALLFAGLLVLLGQPGAEPARADVTEPAEVVEITESDGLVWGMKASWRGYAGIGEWSEGVEYLGGAEGYRWPFVSGTYNSVTNEAEFQFGGRIQWVAHDGLLDVTLSSPRLVINGDDSKLYVEAVSRSESTGDMIDYGEVPIAGVQIEPGDLAIEDDQVAWSALDARLTPEGHPVFSGNYPVNAILDSLWLAYTGPGGFPQPTIESFDKQGAAKYVEGPSTSVPPAGNAYAMFHDAQNGVIHTLVNGVGLLAVDPETLEPVGSTLTEMAGSAYYLPTFDASRGIVFVALPDKLEIATWDSETESYSYQSLPVPNLLYAVHFDVAGDRLLAIDQHNLYSWEPAGDGVWTLRSYARTGETLRANQASAVAADAKGNVVVTTSTVAPLLLDIEGTNVHVSYVPDDFADPGATPVFNQPSTVQALPDPDGGFYLANPNGHVFEIRPDDHGALRKQQLPDGEDRIHTGIGGVGASYLNRATRQLYLLSSNAGLIAVLGSGELQGAIEAPLRVWKLGFSDEGDLFASTLTTLLKYKFVGYTPILSEEPGNQTASLDFGETSKSVLFRVGASDQEDVSIRWQTRIGESGKFADIEGETGETLSLEVEPTDHDRQVRAVVGNDAGEVVSRVATITVNQAPIIAQQPTDVAVLVGADAEFKVFPLGHPAPEITWQRRINGFWQNIHTASGDFELDGEHGGFLTVKNASETMNGTRFRARLRNKITPDSDEWSTTYSSAVELTVSNPVTEPLTFSGGHLDWGVYKRFRCYISTAYNAAAGDCPLPAIAHGEWTLSGGATEPEAGNFRFPAEGGSYNPGTGELEVHLSGAIQFYGHDGVLDITYSNLKVIADESAATLYADVRHRPGEIGSPELVPFETVPGVPLVDLALPEPVAGDGVLVFGQVSTSLTAAGAGVFSYTEGTAFDPLGLSLIEGPWDPDVDPDPEPADPEITAFKPKALKAKTTLATLVCPEDAATACKVSAPNKIKLTASGWLDKKQRKQLKKKFKLAFGKTIAPGKTKAVVLKLTKAQRKVLKGKKLKGSVKVTITAGSKSATKTLKVGAKAG